MTKLCTPSWEAASKVRLFHASARVSARFDDANLISYAGLEPVMWLAQAAGLSEQVAAKVRIRGPLGSKTHHQAG